LPEEEGVRAGPDPGLERADQARHRGDPQPQGVRQGLPEEVATEDTEGTERRRGRNQDRDPDAPAPTSSFLFPLSVSSVTSVATSSSCPAPRPPWPPAPPPRGRRGSSA